MTRQYLYRGVSEELDLRLEGKLIPKIQGPFVYEWTCDTTEFTWDNTTVTIGPSEANAVHWHQASQRGYPTSGISTTPYKEKAHLYAKGPTGNKSGYIYTIDRNKLVENGIREFIVSEYVTHPAIPEDEEVILVADGEWEIPAEVILKKENV